MPHKGILPVDEKVRIVENYLAGKIGLRSTCRDMRIGLSTLKLWIRLYKIRGIEGLTPAAKSRKYSAELKVLAVKEYMAGEISPEGLCRKYDITHSAIVRRWIKKYNFHKEFRTPNSGSGIYMVKGRTVTQEERIEIVSYCISNGKDYGKAIEKYQVSYQQIYSWVQKYEKSGVEGLVDKRGKRKPLDEMNEVERLRAEIKLLEAEKKQKDMEIDILKKLQEVERRRG